MATTGDKHRHGAQPSGILSVDAPQDEGVDLQDERLRDGKLLLCHFLDKGNGLKVIDGFEMFLHRFSSDGQPLLYYQRRLLQRKSIAFYAIALEGVGNVKCLVHLFECSRI